MFEEVRDLALALKYEPWKEATTTQLCGCVNKGFGCSATETALGEDWTHGLCLGFVESLFCEEGLRKGVFDTGDVNGVVGEKGAVSADWTCANEDGDALGFVDYCLKLRLLIAGGCFEVAKCLVGVKGSFGLNRDHGSRAAVLNLDVILK